MKTRRVVWSRDALDELKETAAYIAGDNPAAARRVAAAIRKCGGGLGRAATGRLGRMPGIYEKVVPGLPFIIAYALETAWDGSEAVVLLRMIHGARNWRENEWPVENEDRTR